MKYNDFPILTSSEYDSLSKQFNILSQFNRRDFLQNICLEVGLCLNYCSGIENTFNKSTREQIKQTSILLEKILNNISSQFNIKQSPNHTILNFNFFSFMKQLNKTIILFINWFENEHKEYYKSIAKKSFIELINNENNLFSALEKSKVDFYKYM